MYNYNQQPKEPKILTAELSQEISRFGFASAEMSLDEEGIATLQTELAATGREEYEQESLQIHENKLNSFYPVTDKSIGAVVITEGHGRASLIRGNTANTVSVEPGTVLLIDGQAQNGSGDLTKDATWLKLERDDGSAINITTLRSNKDIAEDHTEANDLISTGAKYRRMMENKLSRQGNRVEKRFKKRISNVGRTALFKR